MPVSATSPQDPTRRRDERRWLFGLALVTLASWGRWLATGSLKVDENYPGRAVGGLLFMMLLCGWALLVLGWHGLLARPPERPRRLALLGLAVAAPMLPMLSNDLFSLFTYGSLAARGHDVYTTAAGLPDSYWYPWVGERWNRVVCVYGPTTLLAIMPAALAGQSAWLALAIYKALWFVPLALVMELSLRRLADRPFFHAFVWLNPLWIVEGPGQLHADLLGLAAITAGLVLARRGRTGASLILYALALLGKYSFAFSGLWFWLSGARSTRARLVRAARLAAVVVGLGALFFAPFWRGPATLTEPLRALGAMNPGGTVTEIVGLVVHFLRGGGIPSPELPVHVALELDRAAKASTWAATSLVMRVLALAVTARILWSVLRRPGNEERLALATGALTVAIATLASHRFQCWYLLAALPFFGLVQSDAWRRWWLAIVAVSPTTDFVLVLPKTSPLLPVWSVLSTGGTVLLFLWALRARYWTAFAPPLDEQPERGQDG